MQQQGIDWGDTPFIPAREIVLIRRLSEGAFGTVYKGIYVYQTVAVKVFREASPTGSAHSMGSSSDSDEVPLIRQMEHEVRVLKNLRHKNVVGFLGAVEDPPALVMEYCRSGSLWDVLRRADTHSNIRKKLSWTRRVNLLLGAAQGMAYVHAGIGTKPEILHRDLKSPNVLLDKDWVVKIADFGLSRFVDPHLNTQWDIVANNPTWMPPEVVDLSTKPHEFNQSTDVYPFGMIMWELLTLEKPWSLEDGTVMRVAQIIACLVLKHERPPIPNELSSVAGVKGRVHALKAYIELMCKCWAQDPETRPSYKEIVVQLQHIKDLFMRRPPPSLDRVKTNEMLAEMLSLLKHPQGIPQQGLPMSESYMEKVLMVESIESGSFLFEEASYSTQEVPELQDVFREERSENEHVLPEVARLHNAVFQSENKGPALPPKIPMMNSPFASIDLPMPLSPRDSGMCIDDRPVPDSPTQFKSPFQNPSTQRQIWPPSEDFAHDENLGPPESNFGNGSWPHEGGAQGPDEMDQG